MPSLGPVYEDAYKMWAEQMAGQVLDPTFLKQKGIVDPDLPTDTPEFWQIVFEQMVDAQNQGKDLLDLHGRLTEEVQGLADSTEEAAQLASKKFNLRKQAQSAYESLSTDELPEAQYADEMHDPALQQQMAQPMRFRDAAELRDTISVMQPVEASQMLKSQIEDDDVIQSGDRVMNAMQIVDDGLDYFFSIPEEDAAEREKAAMMLFEALPASMKVMPPDDQSVINAPLTEASAMHKKYLEEVSDSIKQMALAVVKSRKEANKSFNLRKQAQHHTDQNIIMWGPGQTRPDPFLMGQPVSDWHIVERNKGFGQDLDGIWNIDWEAIWRGNVMDKYSRPYRDEEGNWVGGYIQKRFEVDKWIPEWNNLQLKPGQRRRPYLPQYGSTEARLEHMRAKGERGYGPQSDGDPTMWTDSGFAKMSSSSSSSSSKSFNLRKKAYEGLPGPGMDVKAPLDDVFKALEQLRQRRLQDNPVNAGELPIDDTGVESPVHDLAQESFEPHQDWTGLSREQDPKLWDDIGRARQQIAKEPIAAESKKKSKISQTDRPTEVQLQNAKGNAATQRHHGPDPEFGSDPEYTDNFGRPILDQSKKKVKLIEPIRR